MKPILKGELIKWLKQQEDISALVGDRIYSRIVDAQRKLSAITVTRKSQLNEASHSGPGPNASVLQFHIFALSDATVEEIKQALNDLLDAQTISLDGIEAQFFLANDYDFDDYELLTIDEWAGVLEYECNWDYTE